LLSRTQLHAPAQLTSPTRSLLFARFLVRIRKTDLRRSDTMPNDPQPPLIFLLGGVNLDDQGTGLAASEPDMSGDSGKLDDLT
jgi:hypothetical protein